MTTLAATLLSACATPAEKAASELAHRLVPAYKIRFVQTQDSTECYRFWTQDQQLIVEGSSVSAMTVGLNRYLKDWCR